MLFSRWNSIIKSVPLKRITNSRSSRYDNKRNTIINWNWAEKNYEFRKKETVCMSPKWKQCNLIECDFFFVSFEFSVQLEIRLFERNQNQPIHRCGRKLHKIILIATEVKWSEKTQTKTHSHIQNPHESLLVLTSDLQFIHPYIPILIKKNAKKL